MKGHHERVHPRRAGSLAGPKDVVRSGSVFRSHRRRNVIVLSLVALAVIGISLAAAQFADTYTMRMHVHPQLSATINGSPYTIPAHIGMPEGSWIDHSLDQYGMQGMSPLHTHDASGTIHVESNKLRDFTLREFLKVWGQSIDGSQVLGHLVDAEHRAIIIVGGVEMTATSDPVLKNGEQIRLVCDHS